ncbi:hypothetical protein CsSME_00025176 [Camellia sinensis var. sinensis]
MRWKPMLEFHTQLSRLWREGYISENWMSKRMK